ncbi:ATP-binding protein [Rhizobium grahamii]|uniref:ATP-binding protein n=1 Tax=Rhizobium grahamii TaxID=1120045 RepID=UPI001671E516
MAAASLVAAFSRILDNIDTLTLLDTVIVEPCQQIYTNGDRELLVQMVVDLVENAITHCPPDTVINVSLRREGPAAIITVGDTGPGLHAAERGEETGTLVAILQVSVSLGWQFDASC